MAPFFGASTIVWANTIATVLVALSIGYWLGGRLADKRPHLAQLARWVLVASVLLALVPLVADPFLDLSVQAFDDIDVGAALGSLVGVLALVAVPVLLLGAVSPWAIRLSVDRVEDAGRTAGSLYALSTIGSLIGTFTATLLLIPLVGTQRTFLILAALVALVAALALPRTHLLVPAAIAALIALPTGTTKPLEGARVLEERETEQQYARVVELEDGERRLELNEGQAYPLRLAARLGAHRQRLGRATSPRRSACSAGRRARWPSSATAPARPCAPTRSSSPTRRSTASRSTGS